MVGLSIVLEGYQKSSSISSNKKTPQVINKSTMIKSSPPPSPYSKQPSPSSSSSSSSYWRWSSSSSTFLDHCFLCRQRLLPGKDIFMYKGDRAFCSVDCRYKHIYMDEEESLGKETAAFSGTKRTSSSSSSRKGIRNRADGFAN